MTMQADSTDEIGTCPVTSPEMPPPTITQSRMPSSVPEDVVGRSVTAELALMGVMC